jgi:uncharacterized protein YfeS
MPKQTLYFDDSEIGLDPQTSHPKFNALFQEEFYYDCTDEFSPFGNDDGADTLYSLEDWYQEKGNLKKPLEFLSELIEGIWGMEIKHLRLTDPVAIQQANQENPSLFDIMDRALIATAFGQLKIEGKLNLALKELAFIALLRQKLLTQQQLQQSGTDLRKLLKIVDSQSTQPDEHGLMNHIFQRYLQRLDQMESDLKQVE